MRVHRPGPFMLNRRVTGAWGAWGAWGPDGVFGSAGPHLLPDELHVGIGERATLGRDLIDVTSVGIVCPVPLAQHAIAPGPAACWRGLIEPPLSTSRPPIDQPRPGTSRA